MHIEYLSNGLGAQSMYLLWCAAQHRIPATISITADTGDERDCLWSTGRRSDNRTFFEEIVAPFAARHAIDAHFVRSVDRNGVAYPSITTHLMERQGTGIESINMPLFGSNGGRLKQSCTQRWKIAAIRQCLRRLGATTATGAQGIHIGEAIRRMKGANPRDRDGFTLFDSIEGRDEDGEPEVSQSWSHYYPLVDWRMDRADVNAALDAIGLPYIINSMCDCCPHKGRTQWLRTDPATIERIAALEASLDGLFFTSLRIPLPYAIARMVQQGTLFDDTFDCADGGVCGV